MMTKAQATAILKQLPTTVQAGLDPLPHGVIIEFPVTPTQRWLESRRACPAGRVRVWARDIGEAWAVSVWPSDMRWLLDQSRRMRWPLDNSRRFDISMRLLFACYETSSAEGIRRLVGKRVPYITRVGTLRWKGRDEQD
jgi:hypothetical protein